MPDEIRLIGPDRYEVSIEMPWGTSVPAEMIVATTRGWRERPEARDGRWTSFRIGPAVVAIRFLGDHSCPAIETPIVVPRSRVPVEWN